jgi:hypothetical protein
VLEHLGPTRTLFLPASSNNDLRMFFMHQAWEGLQVYMAVSTVTWGGVHEATKALADVDLQMSTMTNDEAKKAAAVAAASAAAARPSGQSLKAELRTRLGLVGRVRSITGTQGAGPSATDPTHSSDHRYGCLPLHVRDLPPHGTTAQKFFVICVDLSCSLALPLIPLVR